MNGSLHIETYKYIVLLIVHSEYAAKIRRERAKMNITITIRIGHSFQINHQLRFAARTSQYFSFLHFHFHQLSIFDGEI